MPGTPSIHGVPVCWTPSQWIERFFSGEIVNDSDADPVADIALKRRGFEENLGHCMVQVCASTYLGLVGNVVSWVTNLTVDGRHGFLYLNSHKFVIDNPCLLDASGETALQKYKGDSNP